MIPNAIDDIFKITLKHKIYEACVDTFFNKMNINFGRSVITPIIGKRYSKIADIGNGETFYNCVIIPLNKLSYYDELAQEIFEDDEDISDYVFGITFERYVDEDNHDNEIYTPDDLGETHFTVEDLDYTKFYE